MAAGRSPQELEKELDLLCGKMKAQVPVDAAELRTLWLEMVDCYKAVGAAAAGTPTKDEVEQGLAFFKEPVADESLVFIDEFKQICAEYGKSGGMLDTALSRRIVSKDAVAGPDRRICSQELVKGSAEIRQAWVYVIDGMRQNMKLTAIARAVMPEARLLEFQAQRWVDHCATWFQLSVSIHEFARRIETEVNPS